MDIEWDRLLEATEQWKLEKAMKDGMNDEMKDGMKDGMDYLESVAALSDGCLDGCEEKLDDDDHNNDLNEYQSEVECQLDVEEDGEDVLFVAIADLSESFSASLAKLVIIQTDAEDSIEADIDYLERSAQSWASQDTIKTGQLEFQAIAKTTLWSDPNWKASMDFLEACAEDWPQEANGLDWFQFCAMGHADGPSSIDSLRPSPSSVDAAAELRDETGFELLNWKSAFFNLVIKPKRRQFSFSCSAEELSASFAYLGSQDLFA